MTFKNAVITYNEDRPLGSGKAWTVTVDDDAPVVLEDLVTVHAYLCSYPWPKRC
jgi:hypothetical protein